MCVTALAVWSKLAVLCNCDKAAFPDSGLFQWFYAHPRKLRLAAWNHSMGELLPMYFSCLCGKDGNDFWHRQGLLTFGVWICLTLLKVENPLWQMSGQARKNTYRASQKYLVLWLCSMCESNVLFQTEAVKKATDLFTVPATRCFPFTLNIAMIKELK